MGVAFWLGIESERMAVGEEVGDCCRRLLLNESLVMPLEDKEDVLTFVEPQAVNTMIIERLNNIQLFLAFKQ